MNFLLDHAVPDDFLKEEGIFDTVQARALKRALSEQVKLRACRQSCLWHESAALTGAYPLP